MAKVLARHTISGRVEPIDERIVDHEVLGQYLVRVDNDKPVIIGLPKTGDEARERAAAKKAEDAEKRNPTPNDIAPAKTDDKDND